MYHCGAQTLTWPLSIQLTIWSKSLPELLREAFFSLFDFISFSFPRVGGKAGVPFAIP